MPLDRSVDPHQETFTFDHDLDHEIGRSGARWMVAVAVCLVMLGLACTL